MEQSTKGLQIERISKAALPANRGLNHSARLVVDPAEYQQQSPFLLLAEDWFAPPAGFPTHPHRGIETVTIALEGELQHADHTGARGNLREGDVQFMTAGSGIMHSELPGTRGVHSLQLWLNLPAAQKMAQPRYQDVQRSSSAHIPFEGGQMWLYSGEVAGKTMPFVSLWPLTLIDIELEAGSAISIDIPARVRSFVYVLEGSIGIPDDPSSAAKDEILWFARAGEEGNIAHLLAGEGRAARAILYAAEPIDEPVVFGGPFVMNSQKEIEEAFMDLRQGKLTDRAPS
ncbi:pirin family protein [Altererythrobacter sp.]|uniref:pirin family protein n=1 Tax=Altererythrobacter sp. TaxID=1872480 RepID=UPI001B1271AC|nr:pirin family protein [Altererythrobacter sp.]MBO6609393.1 pirin family protein [Altererythrobacter sp.]MBO6640606.1 pirin family protein [Altererythrobacter sp.]MBO6708696.1 pirin family protein [Altererythrobacter sp.]